MNEALKHIDDKFRQVDKHEKEIKRLKRDIELVVNIFDVKIHTKTQLADIIGVSRPTLDKYIDEGLIKHPATMGEALAFKQTKNTNAPRPSLPMVKQGA